MNLRRAQQAVFVKTDIELRQKRMPMSGERHVLIAIKTHAHRLARVMRRQRGQRGGRGGLRFLPAKTAAHARHLDHDFVRRQMQQVGDDRLHLGWMLRGRNHQQRTILAAFRPRGLGFEIKMFLAAQLEFAFERGRCVGKRVVTIAAPDEIRLVVEAIFGERLPQSQDVRQRLIFHHHLFRRRAARLLRFADDERDQMAVKQNLLVRQEDFVAFGADVVKAGDVLGEQYGFDAGRRRAAEASRRRIFARACGEQTGQTSRKFFPAGGSSV